MTKYAEENGKVVIMTEINLEYLIKLAKKGVNIDKMLRDFADESISYENNLRSKLFGGKQNDSK